MVAQNCAYSMTVLKKRQIRVIIMFLIRGIRESGIREALSDAKNTGESSHWNEMPTDEGLQGQKDVLPHFLLKTLLFCLSHLYL